MLWTSHERPQQEQNQRPGVDTWKEPVEAHGRQSFNRSLSNAKKTMEALTFTTSVVQLGNQFQDVPSLGDSALHPST